jgi:hypothetical protein
MDIKLATVDQLLDQIRTRSGVVPEMTLALASLDELSDELARRGLAFCACIWIVDEDVVASGATGKMGIVFEGDPTLCMRGAARLLAEVGIDLVQNRILTPDQVQAIVHQENLEVMKQCPSGELLDTIDEEEQDDDQEDDRGF